MKSIHHSKLQSDVKKSAMAALESNDDVLIRNMCLRILNESSSDSTVDQEECNERAQITPAHATSTLRKKIALRRKVFHRAGGLKRYSSNGKGTPSPSHQLAPQRNGAMNPDSPTGKVIIVENDKDYDDFSVLSRAMDKRFYSPTSQQIEKVQRSATGNQRPRSSTPDFLKYRSSASFNCFKKEARDETPTERPGTIASKEKSETTLFRSSPFSFETQSVVASSTPAISTIRPLGHSHSIFQASFGPSVPPSLSSEHLSNDAKQESSLNNSTIHRGRYSPISRSRCSSPNPHNAPETTKTKVAPSAPSSKSKKLTAAANGQPIPPRKTTTSGASPRRSLYSKAMIRNPKKMSALAACRTDTKATQERPTAPCVKQTPGNTKYQTIRSPDSPDVSANSTEQTTSLSRRKVIASRILPKPSPTNQTTEISAFVRHRASPLSQRDFTIPQPSPIASKKTEERFPSRPLNLSTSVSLRGTRSSVESPPLTPKLGQRAHIAKDSFRIQNASAFSHEIELYRSGQLSIPSPSPSGDKCHGLCVYIRKRPVLQTDLDNGDFDILKVNRDPSSLERKSMKSTSMTIFRTNVTADSQTKLIQPITFGCFDNVFDQFIDGDRVYRAAVKPLVQNVLKHRKPATLLIYGQPGSGRSYTMQECQKHIATEIFNSGLACGELQCLKLVGKKCIDLLNPFQSTISVVNEGNSVQLVGAKTVEVNSTRALLSAFSTCEDAREKQSDRGHLVYQIRISRGTTQLGVLTLVSCSSVERKTDSQTEGQSEVNDSSLYSLKECIRVRTQRLNDNKDHRVPYRASNLTRVLRECLESKDSSISAIGTVSPNATDTEKSIGTLKMVSNLIGNAWNEGNSRKINAKKMIEKPLLAPKEWNHDSLLEWLSKRDLVGNQPIPDNLDGKMIMKMSRIQLMNSLFRGDSDAETKSTRLFRSLRHESERIMRSDLRRKMTIVGLAN